MCPADDGGGTPVLDEHHESDGDEVRSDRHQSEVRLLTHVAEENPEYSRMLSYKKPGGQREKHLRTNMSQALCGSL